MLKVEKMTLDILLLLPYLHFNVIISSDHKIICNLFADHFQKVYTSNDENNQIPNLDHINPIASMSDITLSEDKITLGILSLDSKCSTGPDMLPNIFFD